MTRLITTAEAEIIHRLLRVAPLIDIPMETFASIDSLQVTATCGCGCATIWFGPDGSAANGKIMADGRAAAEGLHIDLIVWSRDSAIIGLEFVGEGPTPLPNLESIRPHEVA